MPRNILEVLVHPGNHMMEREKSILTGCLLTSTCALWHEHMPHPTNPTGYNLLVPTPQAKTTDFKHLYFLIYNLTTVLLHGSIV